MLRPTTPADMLWCALYWAQARQPAQEALWALQFTPRVSPVGAQGLLLEVKGSLRLFGGLDALVQQLRQSVATRLAVATTPQAAWLLARGRDGACVLDPAALPAALSPLPVSVLDAGAAHVQVLQVLWGLGVRTLGELLALPRAGVARRFPAALLDELDRALGIKPDPRPWFEPPATFELTLELMARVEVAEALLFAARRLIAPLCGWLARRHAATRAVHFTLQHDDHASTELPLRLSSPGRDEARFATVLREVLGRTPLAAPVYGLGLRCNEVELASALATELFPTPRGQQEQQLQLLERLQARLGRTRVLRMSAQPDHRPEHAFALHAFDENLPRTAVTCAGPRPLWLLPEPVPIDVHTLTPVSGIERIESGWWEGAWCARDYCVMRDASQALLWVFRPREQPTRWFVQGWFG